MIPVVGAGVRTLVMSLFWSFLLFGGMAAYSELIANSRFLARSDEVLRRAARLEPRVEPLVAERLQAEARRRAALYEEEIERTHLVDGMVVNLSAKGHMMDQCDSLLFSSLRYVSLVKLDLKTQANSAWQAIEQSQTDGRWLRHPRCSRSTSRDMILGVLIAMSQAPEGFGEHLSTLMRLVDNNDGFFGSGPIYVSYLSPGLARFVALLAERQGYPTTKLPEIIRAGYSTAELEVLVTQRGFESHLGALTAWLELELTAKVPLDLSASGTISELVDRIVSPFAADSLNSQRLGWITDRLIAADPSNLFFRYLRLRAAGALTVTARMHMLNELLNMPHFPSDRLPMNCDRSADYLWQRENRGKNQQPLGCNEEYNGTDFLWMAALLLENLPDAGLTNH